MAGEHYSWLTKLLDPQLLVFSGHPQDGDDSAHATNGNLENSAQFWFQISGHAPFS